MKFVTNMSRSSSPVMSWIIWKTSSRVSGVSSPASVFLCSFISANITVRCLVELYIICYDNLKCETYTYKCKANICVTFMHFADSFIRSYTTLEVCVFPRHRAHPTFALLTQSFTNQAKRTSLICSHQFCNRLLMRLSRDIWCSWTLWVAFHERWLFPAPSSQPSTVWDLSRTSPSSCSFQPEPQLWINTHEFIVMQKHFIRIWSFHHNWSSVLVSNFMYLSPYIISCSYFLMNIMQFLMEQQDV